MTSGRSWSVPSPRSLSAEGLERSVRRSLVAAIGTAPISVSRVRTDVFNAVLPSADAQSLPVVWGTTVWSAASGRCIVEQPNGLGLIERGFPDDAIVVGTLGRLRLVDQGGAPDPPPAATGLRGRLLQLGGVRPATRRIETGRFILLFPCAPGIVESVATPSGIAAADVGSSLPELAGGVRFEVWGEVVESDLAAYAAEIGDRLAQVEGL